MFEGFTKTLLIQHTEFINKVAIIFCLSDKKSVDLYLEFTELTSLLPIFKTSFIADRGHKAHNLLQVSLTFKGSRQLAFLAYTWILGSLSLLLSPLVCSRDAACFSNVEGQCQYWSLSAPAFVTCLQSSKKKGIKKTNPLFKYMRNEVNVMDRLRTKSTNPFISMTFRKENRPTQKYQKQREQ